MQRIFLIAGLLLALAVGARAQDAAQPAPAAGTAAQLPSTNNPAQQLSGNPAQPAVPGTAPSDPSAAAAQPQGAVPSAAPVPQGEFRDSFFFSPIEIHALQEALKGRIVRQETLQITEKDPVKAEAPRFPKQRFIRLSGVVYRTPDDWVVWMNHKKITPKYLLPEILEIKVRDSSRVSFKWYDAGMRQIYYITMRPHEVYDVLTGILLPGAGTQLLDTPPELQPPAGGTSPQPGAPLQ